MTTVTSSDHNMWNKTFKCLLGFFGSELQELQPELLLHVGTFRICAMKTHYKEFYID